ncbi:MAG: hypothetical protein O2923_04505 [Verrucomicrobia bacterium]|nr:hypothetical protein [Verrucomicrobiota bacterium]MDA1086605.1 hypothetical protein [Verrucomicrobiota bacterium]
MSTANVEGRHEDLIIQLSAFRSLVAKKVRANQVNLEFDVRTISQLEETEDEPEPDVQHVRSSGGKVSLHLTGISWNEKHPLAFVNGEILGVEDEISGFKVVKIMAESVTMKDGDGETTVLNLYD